MDREAIYKRKLHLNGYGHMKCVLGRGEFVYRLCMYLFHCKIDIVNKIMSPRLKYRQCFLKVDKELAKGTGDLGHIKPHKEEYVKCLHGAWMQGGPMFNASVLFVAYLLTLLQSEVRR